MSRLSTTSATAGRVVTDYCAGLHVARRRKIIPKRKRQYPGFRIRMLEFYVDEIRAVAECIGVNVREFIYQTLLSARAAAALEIGMSPHDLARLDKRQRAAIRHRYVLTVDAIGALKSEGN